MGEVGSRIIEGFKNIMSDLRPDDATHLMALLEIIIRVSPDQGTQIVQPILGRTFR